MVHPANCQEMAKGIDRLVAGQPLSVVRRIAM